MDLEILDIGYGKLLTSSVLISYQPHDFDQQGDLLQSLTGDEKSQRKLKITKARLNNSPLTPKIFLLNLQQDGESEVRNWE